MPYLRHGRSVEYDISGERRQHRAGHRTAQRGSAGGGRRRTAARLAQPLQEPRRPRAREVRTAPCITARVTLPEYFNFARFFSEIFHYSDI